jgi:hypothetical protein
VFNVAVDLSSFDLHSIPETHRAPKKKGSSGKRAPSSASHASGVFHAKDRWHLNVIRYQQRHSRMNHNVIPVKETVSYRFITIRVGATAIQ